MDTMRERFTSVTADLFDQYDQLALVLAVIGKGAFDDAGLAARHPDRVIDVGIREQAMVGVAAGLALEGFRPIVHSYAPFLVERPFEQLKLDFSHQDVGGIFVSVGASHDYAAGGRTHMSPGDVAAVSTLPDWDIHVPGHPDEVEAQLRTAAAGHQRVYIRLSAQTNVDPHHTRGRVQLLRRGTPAAPLVVAIGPMLDPVRESTRDLDVHLAYTATVRPLDRPGLRAAAGSGDVVLVEPYLEGTSLAALASAAGDQPRRYLAIGVGQSELRHYGAAGEHDRAWGLDPASLRQKIEAFTRGSVATALS